MDKEKLEKAASEAWDDYTYPKGNLYPNVFKDAFMKGVEWLLQQPLSDRLVDADKTDLY